MGRAMWKTQSDQDLHCPLTESLDTTKCINGEQMPGWDFVHALGESEFVPFAHARTAQHITKTAYSNILKISSPKTEKFPIKTSDIFHISAQNFNCGYSLEPPRRGGFNEYAQSMFLSRNKKNNVYPCKPQFYYIKVGFKGVKII